jgi:rhodanese-related sulfurtransferase
MANLSNRTQEFQPNLATHPTAAMCEAKLIATELKSRLKGEHPDLTIVDIRPPTAFNQEHIKGAISVPSARLEDLARSSLTCHRSIYIYGESDQQSLQGAQILLATGFKHVAQILGGLTTWREIAGATEGTNT